MSAWTKERSIQSAICMCKDDGLSLADAKKLFVREWMAYTLEETGNNQTLVAEKEGMHRNTVRRVIRKLGIQPARRWKKKAAA